MKNLFLIIAILIYQFSFAQLDPNGVLILNSGTTAEINAISPDPGALIYNTETKKTYVYDGTTWEIASGLNENWTTTGNDQYSALSGNVGIGTTTPNEKLEVNGNLRVNSNSATYSSVGVGPEANDRIISDGTNNEYYGGGIWFRVHDNSAPNQYRDAMMLSKSGNVGIGVLEPTSKLEVAGQVKITGGAPGTGKILTSDANGLATWQEPTSTTVDGILIEGKNQSMFGNSPNNGSCVVSNGIATFFTSTGDNNYMHIKLPYRIDTHNEMYHIKATGYRYGAAKVIDITWVGYCYKNGSALLSTSNTNSGDSEFNITQYVGSDNHIYLRFQGTTGSNYYQSFRIDSMNVGNGSTLTEGDIQIISSASANL